jgi:hypothetical protein
MSNVKLIRWGGLSMILGGLAIVVHYFTHPAGETAQYTLQPLWSLSHWLGFIAPLLILFGLVAIYARQSEKAGWLGLIGFLLAIAGNVAYAGGQMMFGAVMQPFIARQVPTWLDANSPLLSSPAFRVSELVIYLPLILGFLLLGIASLRAGVLPRLGSWLVILLAPVGVVGVAMIGSPLQELLQILVGVVWGLGMLVWGYGLLSEKRQAVAQAMPAASPC